MNNKKIDEVLERRVDKVLPTKDGLRKILKKRKIKIYNGIDPTAKKLHLGHTVGLRKLMEFTELGHEVILLFGTGTVLVGDPSLRDTGRKLITKSEVEENIKTWKKQVSPIVDFDKIKIKYNADWLTKLKLKDIIKIASNISAIQLFKRDMFQKRLARGDTVWYHETMYPLLQGYDSVKLDVDLEIGGSDQEFNMLIGRELQKKMNNREKYVLTWQMIMGTDGKQMSKTTGNCVWLDDKPNDMFGKIMSIPDNQIIPYYELATKVILKKLFKKDRPILKTKYCFKKP
jgi:tyrosyl-tRNA synthetase